MSVRVLLGNGGEVEYTGDYTTRWRGLFNRRLQICRGGQPMHTSGLVETGGVVAEFPADSIAGVEFVGPGGMSE